MLEPGAAWHEQRSQQNSAEPYVGAGLISVVINEPTFAYIAGLSDLCVSPGSVGAENT